MSEQELLDVCNARMQEAEFLRQKDYFHSAIYLLSYALECAMKALIRKRYGSFPHKHSLTVLTGKCGISYSTFRKNQRQVDFISRDENWVEMRYEVDKFQNWNADEKEAYFRAGRSLISFFKKQLV